MKNLLNSFVAVAVLTAVTGCHSLRQDEIEAMTYQGYCKDAAGQALSEQLCRTKFKNDLPIRAQQGETMAANIDKAMEERKTAQP
jgi:hypothetical protein